MERRPAHLAFAPWVGLLLVLSGCGLEPQAVTAPIADRSPEPTAEAADVGLLLDPPTEALTGSFYPLQIGNHWVYRIVANITVRDSADNVYRGETIRTQETRDLVCTDTHGAHEYVVERQVTSGDQSGIGWVWYRQDRHGLFEADYNEAPACANGVVAELSGGATPAPSGGTESRIMDRAIEFDRMLIARGESPERRAALMRAWSEQQKRVALVYAALGARGGVDGRRRIPGPAPGELLRLAYPLHPDTRWVIRPDPRFVSIVEAVEHLQLPAGRFVGHRIRIASELFGDHTRVRVWYGRAGFLKLRLHDIGEATDDQGNVIGTVIFDQTQVLEELSLALRGRITAEEVVP